MGIKEAIQEIANRKEEVYSLIGRVVDVDIDARTCTVAPADGSAVLLNVRLQAVLNGADGFVVVPQKGSDVIVTFLTNNLAYVGVASVADEVLAVAERVALGGLEGEPVPLGEALNANLKELNGNLSTLVQSLNQFTAAQSAASTGPLAPLVAGYTSLTGSLASLSPQLQAWESKLANHLSTKTTTE